jgi:hypothetical protein
VSIVVFCGPTLRAEDVEQELAAQVRPPAARGDLLEAALSRPAAIGLIDGYFSQVPAVWHKEILWAMSEGIAIFGSASMGALRAAELAHFGMIGVGEIFEQYQSGELEDDDEVAVTHADAAHGFRPLSEPLVNVRATLRAAVASSVIASSTGASLLSLAKALGYQHCSYPLLLARARGELSRPAELERLEHWLPSGRIDQKRNDAILMLRRMAESQRAGSPARGVEYQFARTDAWETLRSEVETRLGSARAGSADQDWTWRLNEELLVAGTAASVHEGAFTRALSLERARQSGARAAPAVVAEVVDDFRRERDLQQAETFAAWLAAQALAEDEVAAYYEREALVRRTKAAFEPTMLRHLVDHLRAAGLYGSLHARAQAKLELLSKYGGAPRELMDLQLSEEALWRWYFEERLSRSVPEDLAAYARSMHAGLEQLRAAVVREYCYVERGEYFKGEKSGYGNDS